MSWLSTNVWLYCNPLNFVTRVNDFLLDRPITLFVVSAAVSYYVWYRTCVVRKPSIHSGEGRLRSFLLEHCHVLKEKYWPTFWAVNCHLCTIVRSLIQRKTGDVSYERHEVETPDGGLIALDFGSRSMSPSTPILLILPGLTGDVTMNYIVHFAMDAYLAGYRPVVFNQRGTAGLPLLTARLFSATSTEDLEHVIDYVKMVYPDASIIALGVSLGGIILSHYVSNAGSLCKLSAAITVSTPLHPPSSQWSLENKWFNKRVYIDFLVNNLLGIVKRHTHVLERHPSFDMKRIQRINSLSQFDAAITAPIFGYDSVNEYYADASLVNKICKIKIPYICLVAEDDPFIPFHGFPIDEFDASSDVFLIVTKRGGHFGFLEGVYPRGRTWMNRVNEQLLQALKYYHYHHHS